MKKIILFFVSLILVLCFVSCGVNDYVGIDKAKQTVVDDIGAAIDEVEFAFNDLITDDNGDYYRLKFSKDGINYVYEVDAMTGKILNKTTNTNEDDKTTSTSENIIKDNNETTIDNSDNLLNNNDNTIIEESVSSTTSM